MQTGAITGYVDVAQIVLYVFWIFFAFLILYLRREDKREGYPLESDRSDRVRVQGFPSIPAPKVFALPHGGTYEAPNEKRDTRSVAARPTNPWPGAPLEPTGDPMRDGVGPASFAERTNQPELTLEGQPRIVPMRVASDFTVEERDPDPRGMEVIGADGEKGGTVRDIWVDRSEPQVRYLELELAGGGGPAPATPGEGGAPAAPAGPRRVLLPITMARVNEARRTIKVESILGRQFAHVPGLDNPDRVTQREEDRICAYYGGGHLFATPQRREPQL